jgi:hypothetical protein
MKPIAAYRHSPYVSSIKRSSTRPLVRVPFTFSEVAGPSFGPELISQASYDLTGQHKGEPLGERIIVSGRVLDENSRPPANTLVEVPQGFAPGMTAGTSVCTCATTSPGSRTTLIANVIRQKSFILIMRVLFRRVIPSGVAPMDLVVHGEPFMQNARQRHKRHGLILRNRTECQLSAHRFEPTRRVIELALELQCG